MMRFTLHTIFIASSALFIVGCFDSLRDDTTAPRSDMETSPEDVFALGEMPDIQPASDLKKTDVIPHTSAAITVGRNYVYCGTFKLAWDQYANKSAVQDSQMAKALKQFEFSMEDIAEDSYVLAHGSPYELQSSVKASFPHVELAIPEFMDPSVPGTIVYLQKALPFREYFDIRPKPLQFLTNTGPVSVEAFGLENFAENSQRDTLHRSQISIVEYRSRDDFVVRLNTLALEDELILAKVPPEATLAKTILEVRNRTQRGYASDSEQSKLQDGESFIMPIISVAVLRRYSELSQDAFQAIRFRLDEKGAKLESYGYYASLADEPAPRRLIFDKPFLVYLVRKGRQQPYFAAWIENSEMLVLSDADT